jgi:hypothetical protein
MSDNIYHYVEEYETNIDYTCKDCDKDNEDIEVTVSAHMAVVKCECGYENEIEIDDE